MKELQGQVAIVTGAGRGFGKAIAKRLAAEGAAVAATARTKAQLDEVCAEIEADGGRAIPVAADVTNRDDVIRVVSEARGELGDISLLINNAGLPGPFGPIWEIDPDVWWRSQAVHIRAPMLFLREVLPSMVERGAGRVIIVSAIASRLVAPYLSAYCVGKIAQTRIVEELAAETKDRGVSAFAIDPGFVFTGIAHETMNSPDAQRWLPQMVARLQARRDEAGSDADLVRCAQRCVDLASGRYDALSGKYMELTDDLDGMVRTVNRR
jgi:NAD(P)-dependent dehydrogenase (short-subunit alcohol dehydrogenase family)